MKRVWNKVIIISFIVLLLECIASVILFTPYYKMHKLFNDIDEGHWSEVKENFDAMSEDQKSEALSYMDDYAVGLCNEYIDGDKSYIHTAASFDAINSVEPTGYIMEKYMPSINHNEYKKAINDLADANSTFNTNKAYEAKNTITAVQQRMNNETREKIMIEMLNEKYQSYLDEELVIKDMNSFTAIISGMSYYDAYSYVGVILNNVNCVERYRELYLTAQSELSLNNYFNVMEIYNSVEIDPYDLRYRELYDTLYNDAYTTGKAYYGNMLNSYIDKDDSENAVVLMENIEKYYGDDFNLNDAKTELAEDWQKKYIDIASNIDTILHTELSATETGQYIFDKEYSKLKPDSLLLYDVNDDGIPELFMFNSKNASGNYVGCFMFGYEEDDYKYMGFVNVISFCSDSNIIAFPLSFDRTEGEEYSLVEYDGSSIVEVSYCQKIDSKYYVNGEETNDVDYLSSQSGILAHANDKTIQNSGYKSINDSESYIIAY